MKFKFAAESEYEAYWTSCSPLTVPIILKKVNSLEHRNYWKIGGFHDLVTVEMRLDRGPTGNLVWGERCVSANSHEFDAVYKVKYTE